MNQKRRAGIRRANAVALAIGALLAGSALIAPAPTATAAPWRIFDELWFDDTPASWTDSACTSQTGPVVDPPEKQLDDNAVATTSASRSETFTPRPEIGGTDTMTVSLSQTTKARAAAQNDHPSLLQVDFSGQAAAASAGAAPGVPASCKVSGQISGNLRFTFTIRDPLWANLSYVKTGSSYAEAYLYGTSSDQPYEDLIGRLFKGSGSSTVLLPPGEYAGYVRGQTFLPTTDVSRKSTARGTVRMTFAEMGSANALPSGTAKSDVALASARGCAVHALSAKLSGSAKRIRSISSVSFAVNGKTVKTLKGRQVKRGVAVKLSIRDDVQAAVKVTVKPKKGKTRTVGASYRPCS